VKRERFVRQYPSLTQGARGFFAAGPCCLCDVVYVPRSVEQAREGGSGASGFPSPSVVKGRADSEGPHWHARFTPHRPDNPRHRERADLSKLGEAGRPPTAESTAA